MGLFNRQTRNSTAATGFAAMVSAAGDILNEAAVETLLWCGHQPTQHRPADRVGVESPDLAPFMLEVRGGYWVIGDVQPDDAPMTYMGSKYQGEPGLLAVLVAGQIRMAWAERLRSEDLDHGTVFTAQWLRMLPAKKLLERSASGGNANVAQAARTLLDAHAAIYDR